MSEKKVLILYGSRYGGAQGIAEKMSELLKDRGVETAVFDLKKTSQSEIPALEHFDGLLLRSWA